jgi:FHS family L-fucose permease-like MFS transporter
LNFYNPLPIAYAPKNEMVSVGILISVFFFWGFVAASNDILIPVFQEKLQLEAWQSQMISSRFM